MNADNLIRRYWAGGYHFGQENSQLEKFISNETWKIGWSKEDEKGRQFYQKINEVKIRAFTSNSDAFGFWNNENEDIYQDYLKNS